MQYYMAYINVTREGHDIIRFNPHHDGAVAYREDVEKELAARDTEISRFRSILVALQLSVWTQIYRQQRAISPILAHADAPDTAPPLRISVSMARETKEKVEDA